MGVRSAEFLFWWMLKVLGRVFGYLLLVSGLLVAALFALNVYVLQPSAELDAALGHGPTGRMFAVAIPLATAALGAVIVALSHHYPRQTTGLEKRTQ